MATPKSTNIVLSIKGRDWNFILMSDTKFDKLHTTDDAAMTVPAKYEAHFRKTDWNNTYLKHELLHILFNMCNTGSSELTPIQVEEIMCDIVGAHCEEILMWTARISERFQQK